MQGYWLWAAGIVLMFRGLHYDEKGIGLAGVLLTFAGLASCTPGSI